MRVTLALIAALGARLADDYLVLPQDRKPEGDRRAVIILAIGLALTALSPLLLLRRGARPAQEPAEEPAI